VRPKLDSQWALFAWALSTLRLVLGLGLVAAGLWLLHPLFYALKETLMRTLIVASLLGLAACANIPGYPPAQAQNDKCFYQTVKEAFNGDFSNWVLPDFIGGKHLKAGQVAPCMAKVG
jgi:hypothetical protein